MCTKEEDLAFSREIAEIVRREEESIRNHIKYEIIKDHLKSLCVAAAHNRKKSISVSKIKIEHDKFTKDIIVAICEDLNLMYVNGIIHWG